MGNDSYGGDQKKTGQLLKKTDMCTFLKSKI